MHIIRNMPSDERFLYLCLKVPGVFISLCCNNLTSLTYLLKIFHLLRSALDFDIWTLKITSEVPKDMFVLLLLLLFFIDSHLIGVCVFFFNSLICFMLCSKWIMKENGIVGLFKTVLESKRNCRHKLIELPTWNALIYLLCID